MSSSSSLSTIKKRPQSKRSSTRSSVGGADEEDEQVVVGSLNVSLSQGTISSSQNKRDSAATAGGDASSGGPFKIKGDEDEHVELVDPEVAPPAAAGAAAVVLPDTVTVLEGPGGSRVYLVGTAHFSTQSQTDVRTLCHARRNILTLDEETILREASDLSLSKLRSSGIQGLLHFVLLSMSAQLTRKLGMAPGGEFRAALQEARGITNCVLVLGDRPFNVTISRALSSLTLWQKLKLAYQFIASSSEDITKEEIERCKERDLLEKMLSEMTGEFPSITEVFVNERDVFLAHSLLLAAQQQTEDSEGAAAASPAVVVGVVGMGHVKGIAQLFGTTTDDDVKKINTVPVRSRTLLGSVVRCAVWGGVAYGVYVVVVRRHTPAIIGAVSNFKQQLVTSFRSVQ